MDEAPQDMRILAHQDRFERFAGIANLCAVENENQIKRLRKKFLSTICVSQLKTLAPRNLFWELPLTEGAGDCPAKGATSKINLLGTRVFDWLMQIVEMYRVVHQIVHYVLYSG